MMRRYPTLDLLFGAYLHQDWDVENADPEQAVRLFAESEAAHTVRSAIKEIEDILSGDITEAFALSEGIQNAGLYYDPADDGRTWQSWLSDVHRILGEELHRGNE
jgi:hypothetical protein